MNHGTRHAYDRYGCRCADCRAVKAEAKRRERNGLYIDEIAVERACKGDLTITLNGAELAAAYAYLNSHGYSLRRIAAVLGVSGRTVSRWRSGQHSPCHARPGRKDVA